MAGLMSGGMGGARQTVAQRNPMNEGDEEANVTPEEQALYTQFVENGEAIIHDKKVMPELFSRMEAAGDPIEGVANVAAMVVMRVEDSARKAGQDVEEVKFHAGVEILELVIELAEQAGVHEFTPQDIERATMLTMDAYRDARMADGSLPAEEIGQDMQMLMEAEQQGRLNEVVPGAEEYAAEKAQQQAPPGTARA